MTNLALRARHRSVSNAQRAAPSLTWAAPTPPQKARAQVMQICAVAKALKTLTKAARSLNALRHSGFKVLLTHCRKPIAKQII
jgi:hypothetical protein